MQTSMIKNLLSSALWLASSLTLPATAAPFVINAYGIHSGNNIVYRYQIVNNSDSFISGVDLGTQEKPIGGVESGMPGLPWERMPWALSDDFENAYTPLPRSQCKPFVGMDCKVAFNPEYYPVSTLFTLSSLNIPLPSGGYSKAYYIRPKTLSSVAEITIPRAYQSLGYLTARGRIYLLVDDNTRNPDGSIMTDAYISFTKLDTTAPTLSVTMSPAVIYTNQLGKAISVTANLSSPDDYDPAPEIKLIKVTALGGLTPLDIKGALPNTDDRTFSITPSGTLTGIGQQYLFHYSAMDASGNQKISVGRVTVK